MTRRCPCGQSALAEFGTRSYCVEHLSDLLRAFASASFGLLGRAVVLGAPRPDHGASAHDVECTICEADWVGRPGSLCPWCCSKYLHALDRSAHLLLHPALPVEGDPRRAAALARWGERIREAVDLDIVAKHDALAALHRQAPR